MVINSLIRLKVQTQIRAQWTFWYLDKQLIFSSSFSRSLSFYFQFSFEIDLIAFKKIALPKRRVSLQFLTNKNFRFVLFYFFFELNFISLIGLFFSFFFFFGWRCCCGFRCFYWWCKRVNWSGKMHRIFYYFSLHIYSYTHLNTHTCSWWHIYIHRYICIDIDTDIDIDIFGICYVVYVMISSIQRSINLLDYYMAFWSI